MSEQFLIDDGYTIDGTIAREPGIHPALAFTYRPALAAERNAHLKAAQDPAKRHKVDAALIAEHVQSWSVADRKGGALDKPTLALAERLQPTLMVRLVDVILGYSASGEEGDDAKNS